MWKKRMGSENQMEKDRARKIKKLKNDSWQNYFETHCALNIQERAEKSLFYSVLSVVCEEYICYSSDI